jgi:phosphoglycerol transferase MdoB-like AlkP superfamily enzyme
MIPTYPLVELNSAELQLVQNSFHTFLYSAYRKDEAIVKPYNFFAGSETNKLTTISKVPCEQPAGSQQKNIVLFIMESIPEDFFNAASKYKVAMPFLDSLVKQSTYFDNAYSYGHSSNKGIVSILTGIPTLTEIPLYHSNYATIGMTAVGTRLAANGYSSSFFIGDRYDDFGFAKCSNWLGIQNYYSKESVPGKNMETNTMGLHDRYVLDFMGNKINEMKQPFLAINYNTSTHFPNDLPKGYKEKYPQQNFSDQMKCMNYYNECLQDFFSNASKQSWYNNTMFIFCSDHWMYPDAKDLSSDIVQGFHIPIFIYDPAKPQQKIVSSPVSQLDVLNTILCIAGTKEPFISYGNNLLDTVQDPNRAVFSKENSNLYQVMDSSYVLGFNPVTGKPEFCYNYKTDKKRINNLLSTQKAITLTIKMKAFLQTASYHYNKKHEF